MSPLQHTEDQFTVETLGFSGRNGAEEGHAGLQVNLVMATTFGQEESECCVQTGQDRSSMRDSYSNYIWDCQGKIFVNHLEKGKTTTGAYLRCYWTD